MTLDRLFVYGTLLPGREYAHILADLGGSWEPAFVRGTLYPEGIGAAAGWPVLILDQHGPIVNGQVLSSSELAAHWARVDDFEGPAYRRVRTSVTLSEGSTIVEAFVYVLKERLD